MAQITSGPWEVRGMEHVDSKNGWIYFSGTRDNALGTNFYRAKLGGPIERLTQSDGSHNVSMSTDGQLFLSSWSDTKTPTRQRLYGADGRLVRDGIDLELNAYCRRAVSKACELAAERPG